MANNFHFQDQSILLPGVSLEYKLFPYRRLKTKGNFKLLAIKVVAVTYERWWLTRGFKYSDH